MSPPSPAAALPRTPSSPAAGVPRDAVYGVLQLGVASVALALDVLREVLPCPEQFCGLPAAAPGLLGAVNVRGKVLPVLDLRAALGLPAERRHDQVVVLVRHEGQELGLLADSVRGLTRLSPDQLHRMNARSGPLLYSGSFERSEDHSVVSVLDAGALMALPGMPLLRDEQAGSSVAAEAAVGRQQALMLVRCGGIRLAMEVTEIHTTLPTVRPEPSSMDGRLCRGVIAHDGARIAAVDPLALMGLGALPEGEACQALVLKLETGFVALLVSAVIDIVRVAHADLLSVPPLTVRRPALFQAVLQTAAGGQTLVVAAGALHADNELRALASLNTRLAGSGPAGRADRATARARTAHTTVITYDIGAEVATQLDQIDAVMTLPTDFTRPEAAHPCVIGICTHRQHAITLVCLSHLLGTGPSPWHEDARVLLLTQEGWHFGFVVPRLCHIESTVWQQPVQAGTSARRTLLGAHPVIEIGAGEQRRTLQLVDLRALARSLLGLHDPAVDAGATVLAADQEAVTP